MYFPNSFYYFFYVTIKHKPQYVFYSLHTLFPRLDSLNEVHRARQAELRRMEGDVESAKTSVEILEESSSESQLKFYRAVTLYIHNLVECLREKVRNE